MYIYCISLSLYISILLLLNPDIIFEQLAEYMYSLEVTELKINIHRFIIWTFGKDEVEFVIDSYIN